MITKCILCDIDGEFWQKKPMYGKHTKEYPNGVPESFIRDFHMWKCPKCELIWVNDLDDNYEEVYSSGKYWNELAVNLSRMVLTSPERIKNDIKYAKLRVPEILQFTKPCEYYEVGCSGGALMKELNDLGFKGIGFELDSEAANTAKQYSGSEVYNSNLSTVDITMFSKRPLLIAIDILEHVRDPIETVKAWVRMVECNGIIIIECPNAEWYKNDIQDSYYTIHEHVFHYSRQHLERLFKKFNCMCIQYSNPFTNDRQRLVFRKVF